MVLTTVNLFCVRVRSCVRVCVCVRVGVCVCVCVFPRLIMEFELRTTEDSGLVLYMARINHADFVTIQVRVR